MGKADHVLFSFCMISRHPSSKLLCKVRARGTATSSLFTPIRSSLENIIFLCCNVLPVMRPVTPLHILHNDCFLIEVPMVMSFDRLMFSEWSLLLMYLAHLLLLDLSLLGSAALSAVEAALVIKFPYSMPTCFSRQIVVSCGINHPPQSSPAVMLGCVGGAADEALAFFSAFTIPLVGALQFINSVSVTMALNLTRPLDIDQRGCLCFPGECLSLHFGDVGFQRHMQRHDAPALPECW